MFPRFLRNAAVWRPIPGDDIDQKKMDVMKCSSGE